MKTLSNQKPKTGVSIKDKDGNIITDTEKMKERWAEIFMEVLNRPQPERPITDEEILQISPTPLQIDVGDILDEEIKQALKKTQNGKAPGLDHIEAELFKADPASTTQRLHPLFNHLWDGGEILESWTKGHIIKVPKNLRNCQNLTDVPAVNKIYGRLSMNCRQAKVDKLLHQEQASFRKGRNTTEQIFILRNIIKQVHDWQATLYISFIDFENVFDSVHKASLWKIMSTYSIPQKVVNAIKLLYNYFQCLWMERQQSGSRSNPESNKGVSCQASFFFL